MSVTLREVAVEDIAACALICHKAFTEIADKHGFPTDFPNPAVAEGMMSFMLGHSNFYGVVAELDGKIVGSNFLDERGEVTGLGPISVSVAGQNRGVGKLLMQHCLDRSEQRKVLGVRLLQAAYHNRSLSLYTSLGFDVQDVVSTLQGPPIKQAIAGYQIRPAVMADLPVCSALCQQTHGHKRDQEMQDGINAGTATVAVRSGNIEGFLSLPGYTGFAVANTNDALKALIAAAPEFMGPGFLLPSGNGEVMRWCFQNGLKVVQQLTVMSKGYFQRPNMPYMPSILY